MGRYDGPIDDPRPLGSGHARAPKIDVACEDCDWIGPRSAMELHVEVRGHTRFVDWEQRKRELLGAGLSAIHAAARETGR